MTYRDPKGHFIERASMLSAWLPSFLEWAWHDAIEVAVAVCIAHCAREMAQFLNSQSAYLLDHTQDQLPYWSTNNYAQWSRRRDILLEALTKLRAVK